MMATSKTVLVVEDESDLRQLIGFNLEREGFVSDCAATGEEALRHIERRVPHLVILDRMLPERSGDDVLSHMKRDPRTASIPVIMLTAKADESDELVGFAMGADDYVTKPFSMKALMARVGALLRRVDAATDDDGGSRITCGPVTMDADRFEVLADGAPVTLTPTEFKLLKALISAGGRLRTRDRLIDEAVGIDVAVVDRTIDVHIASLRKKLGAHAGWIQTIRGAGYVWRPPVADDD